MAIQPFKWPYALIYKLTLYINLTFDLILCDFHLREECRKENRVQCAKFLWTKKQNKEKICVVAKIAANIEEDERN